MKIFYQNTPQSHQTINTSNSSNRINNQETLTASVSLANSTHKDAIDLISDNKNVLVEKIRSNPNEILTIINNQADRLGYSVEEKTVLLHGLLLEDLLNIIHFMYEWEWVAQDEVGTAWIVDTKKLKSNTTDELMWDLFRTPWIIEVYPNKCEDVPGLYSTISHEINHLLMMPLITYRMKKQWKSEEEIIAILKSDNFEATAETLAYLDGGQAPMNIWYFSPINMREVSKVRANENNPNLINSVYFSAKLRAFKLHELQMKIYNLPSTNNKNYQKWCQEIRDFILKYIDNPEWLKTLDSYIEKYLNDPERARNIFIQEND